MFDDLGLRLPQIDLVWTVRAFFAHFGLGFWTVLITAKLFAPTSQGSWFRADFSALLRLGFWGGVANNLVDLDHLSMIGGHPHGRIWHTQALWLAATAIALFLLFLAVSARKICERPGCPACRNPETIARWRRRFGFAALMGVSVVVHVLEDYYIGAF